MKSIVVIFLVILSVNVFSFELSKEDKAILASKTLYALNLGPIEKASFSLTRLDCNGDDTIEICVARVDVANHLVPGVLWYRVDFKNLQLSSINQVCPYCY